MRRLYLASNNRHKAEELQALAGGRFDVRIARELDPAVAWDESGETFLANAKIKAAVVQALVRAKAPGAAILADDSGLCVDALGGAPGVHSSRYAGKDGDDAANNAKLLLSLADVPLTARTARFVCTLYFVDGHGEASTFVGECPGRILTVARGTHGFGYDPLFQCDGEAISMAEMTATAKNAVSHRGRAIQAWLATLRP